MGARGPLPADKRKRRNATLPMTELPRGRGSSTAPELPGRSKFVAATRAWYRTWSRSEQATQFTATDWQRLHMLAPVVDAYHRMLASGQVTSAMKLLPQIERTEARFGATADDRQRLRWKVTGEELAPQPVRESSRRRDDPRRLKAVQ